MAITALILGICGLVLSIIGGCMTLWGLIVDILAILMCLAAIILGAMGRKGAAKKGAATAGMVLGIVGLSLGVILTICCYACPMSTVEGKVLYQAGCAALGK